MSTNTASASTPSKTTIKFSLENPYYRWPNTPDMECKILISKLNDLKASVGKKEFDGICILDPNVLLRDLEGGKVGIVFAFVRDLKYGMAVAHLPFMCRLKGVKLVAMEAGSAAEFNAYFSQKKEYLFMFALRNSPLLDAFLAQFPPAEPIDPTIIPALEVKK